MLRLRPAIHHQTGTYLAFRRHFGHSNYRLASKKSDSPETNASATENESDDSTSSQLEQEETPFTKPLLQVKVKPRERTGAPARRTTKSSRKSTTSSSATEEESVKSPHASSSFYSSSKRSSSSDSTLAPFSFWSLDKIPSPKALKKHLDLYAIGQDQAKKHFSVAVYNHYVRLADRAETTMRAEMRRAELRRIVAQEMERHQDNEDFGNLTPDEIEEQREYERILQKNSNWFQPPPWMKMSQSLESKVDESNLQRVLKSQPGLRAQVSQAFNSQASVSPTSSGMGDIHSHEVEMDKANVLLLGPTGSGKTMLARILAKALDVPFVIMDCTSLTQTGYVGDDPDACISRLAQAADWDADRTESGIVVFDEFDKIACKDVSGGSKGSGGGAGGSDGRRDVAGEGVQQGMLKLVEGAKLTLALPSSMQAGYGPNKTETIAVDTSNVLFVFMGAFVGLEKIIAKRLQDEAEIRRAADVYLEEEVDEEEASEEDEEEYGLYNKNENVIRHNKELPITLADIFKKEVEEVYRDNAHNFLQQERGLGASSPTIATLKSTPKSTSPSSPAPIASSVLAHVTHADLVKYGILPELAGRIAVLVSTTELTVDDLVRVLTEPRNSVVRQYERLFSRWGVTLAFTAPALKAVARRCVRLGIGARGLPSVLSSLLLESNFESPESGTKYILVTQQVVNQMDPAEAGGPKPLYFSKFQASEFLDAVEVEDPELAQQLNSQIFPHFTVSSKKKATA